MVTNDEWAEDMVQKPQSNVSGNQYGRNERADVLIDDAPVLIMTSSSSDGECSVVNKPWRMGRFVFTKGVVCSTARGHFLETLKNEPFSSARTVFVHQWISFRTREQNAMLMRNVSSMMPRANRLHELAMQQWVETLRPLTGDNSTMRNLATDSDPPSAPYIALQWRTARKSGSQLMDCANVLADRTSAVVEHLRQRNIPAVLISNLPAESNPCFTWDGAGSTQSERRTAVQQLMRRVGYHKLDAERPILDFGATVVRDHYLATKAQWHLTCATDYINRVGKTLCSTCFWVGSFVGSIVADRTYAGRASVIDVLAKGGLNISEVVGF